MEAVDNLEDWISEIQEETDIPEFESTGMDKVVQLAEHKVKLEREIEKVSNLLKEMNLALRDLEWDKIPEAMDEAGLEEFTLKTGETLGVKPYLHCKISTKEMDDNQRAHMYDWLIEHQHDNLIRTSLNYDLDRGEFAKAQKIREAIEKEFGIVAPLKHEVKWQTLDKWAREMNESGEDFPHELFNLNVGRRAVIKKGK